MTGRESEGSCDPVVHPHRPTLTPRRARTRPRHAARDCRSPAGEWRRLSRRVSRRGHQRTASRPTKQRIRATTTKARPTGAATPQELGPSLVTVDRRTWRRQRRKTQEVPLLGDDSQARRPTPGPCPRSPRVALVRALHRDASADLARDSGCLGRTSRTGVGVGPAALTGIESGALSPDEP